MRNATLSAPAIDAVRPARSASGTRATAANGHPPRKRPGAARRLSARLSVIVGSAGFCAIMIGIVINATMFQKGHHPAPLFASAAPARPVVAEPPPPLVPHPVAPPVVLPTMPAAVEPRPLPAAISPAKPTAAPLPAASSKAAPARHADGIARLLGTLEHRAPARTARPAPPAHAKAALARPAAPMVN